MQENSKKELKKKIIYIGLIIPVLVVIIGVSYAFFNVPVEKEEEKISIRSGDLALTFKDNDEAVENIEGTWNFGDTIEKELVIENTGTRDAFAKISWDDLINTYLAESLTYTLEEKSDDTGAVWKNIETANANVPRSEATSTQLLADHLLVPAGHTYTYRVRITFENLPDIDQTQDLNAQFITKFTLNESTKKLTVEEILANLNIKISETNLTNFRNPATTDETADGLFAMADDYGTSYYFRGTAPNNYIKFGKNASGQDMWWRIIRFNGDGTVRMQYDGAGTAAENAYTRGFALTNQVWNSYHDDAKYVGWMFGGLQGKASISKEEALRNETNSEIKIAVDNWYKRNILDTGYGDYVADVIFCNDRETSNSGFGNDLQNFSVYGRMARHNPKLNCSQENDKFTVSVANGNGALTYPVGLLTADEIMIAGGIYSVTNNDYYLHKDKWYWTMSAYRVWNKNVYIAIENGGEHQYAHYEGAVAPVINLKVEYLDKLQGNGTIDNPYFLQV